MAEAKPCEMKSQNGEMGHRACCELSVYSQGRGNPWWLWKQGNDKVKLMVWASTLRW